MIKSANVGKVDSAVRLIAGIALIFAPVVFSFQGSFLQWLIPLVGLVLALTALIRFCPLYRLIGANTCKVD